MGKGRRVPERWEKYLPVGCHVPGTRFLPFKVPLKLELCRNRPEEEWFTPSSLLENTPMLKAIIDLTNTDRYYNKEEFTTKGVLYKKIHVEGGGTVPSKKILDNFFNAVDELCRTLVYDADALIGVHCTHGLNRTGYLICKYMVLRMKIDPQEAINKFEDARGYPIERKNYVSDILSDDKILNWQRGPRSEPRGSRSEPRGQRSEPRGPRSEPRGPRREPRGPREFGEARGYPIERKNYVSHILSEDKILNWRREPRNEPRGPRSEPRGPRGEPRGPRSEPRGSRIYPSSSRSFRPQSTVLQLSEYNDDSHEKRHHNRYRNKNTPNDMI